MGFNRNYQSGMIVIYDLHPWSVRDLQRCRTPRDSRPISPPHDYMPHAKAFGNYIFVELAHACVLCRS